MTTLKELMTYLNALLKPELYDDFGPNGLQVEGKEDIKRGAFAVSASLAAIKKAEEWGADFLFTHHGLFWNRDPYPIIGTKKKKLSHLLKNDISLISYHLPLDAHETLGNNWKAAKDLGWENLESFGNIGVKGTFKKTTRNSFQEKLEKFYGQKAQVALGGKESITTAALISGGAYRETLLAAKQDLDCYITGNFDEPVWHWAMEEGINFFALGHAATEKIGPKALMEELKSRFNIETLFIDESNPF